MELPAPSGNFTSAEKAKAYLASSFEEIYGPSTQPVRFFFAPGRVNLIGEHTDYNGGYVLPCALTSGTYGAARKRNDGLLRFCSLSFPDLQIVTCRTDDLSYQKKDGWSNYPKGVVQAFAQEGFVPAGGMDLLVAGTLPIGAGLSSSASLEVLTGLALRTLYDFPVTDLKIALFAQKAENEFCGAHTGIMDPFVSMLGKAGHALLLQTSSLQYEEIPVNLADCCLLLTNTMVKHSLASSAYNDRRYACELTLEEFNRKESSPLSALCELSPDEFEKRKGVISNAYRRAQASHVIYENKRTEDAAAALKQGNLEKLGSLLYASHESLKNLYRVSCPELDFLVSLARKFPGVLGSRMTGGGFGGCTVTLIRKAQVSYFMEHTRSAYEARFQKTPAFYPVEIGQGASEL